MFIEHVCLRTVTRLIAGAGRSYIAGYRVDLETICVAVTFCRLKIRPIRQISAESLRVGVDRDEEAVVAVSSG